MIQLNTLGTLDLLDLTDGHQVLSILAQPKRVGFLTYLAVASPRGPHQRDTLLGFFWPDSTDKKARNALNQTAFVLRRALGQELFTLNGEHRIGVDSDVLRCDVWEFEAALAAGEKAEALDWYKGNFLEGFYLTDCHGFERWVDSERSRLRDLATGAVLSLAREMETAGSSVGAMGWLRRAREWAPYDELVLRCQVSLLNSLGDHSSAVLEFESFARRLSEDLELEPSDEAKRLIDRPSSASPGYRAAGAGAQKPPLPPMGNPEPLPKSGRRFSLPQTLAIAGLAGVIGIGAVILAPSAWRSVTTSQGPETAELTVPRRVAVLPLKNATGDPNLDHLGRAAADEIIQEIASAGLASVGPVFASGETTGGSGDRLGNAGEEGNSLRTLGDAEYVVDGSYFLANGKLAYRARILDLGTGSVIMVVDTVMGSLAEPMVAAGRLKDHVAGALAMALDSRLSGLAQVASHPHGFAAYQILADGLDLLHRGDRQSGPVAKLSTWEDAAETFLQAAAMDPGSTLPLVFSLEASTTVADSVLGLLQSSRESLPRWERAMLDHHLARRARDYPGQYHAMARVVELSPSPEWKYRLAENAIQTNRPREALEILTELGSDRYLLRSQKNYWMWLIEARLLLGEYEPALLDIDRARALPGQSTSHLAREVYALTRLGREDEATDRSIEIIESTGASGTRYLRYYLARILRAGGFEDQARRVAEVGLTSFDRIEGARADYVAGALVCAGRYDEARQLLANPGDGPVSKAETFSLLAYMAATEGDAGEATRLSELAVTANDPTGDTRNPYGMMSRVEVAAQLGDNAGAVRFLREAFGLGLPHGSYIVHRWDLRPLAGYKPFEDLIRPKG